MNDRIYTLATRAWMTEQGSNRDPIIPREFIDKFAELIVRECVESLWTEECYNSDLALEEFERNSAKIKQHFGVDGMSTEDKKTLIKELLGVKND